MKIFSCVFFTSQFFFSLWKLEQVLSTLYVSTNNPFLIIYKAWKNSSIVSNCLQLHGLQASLQAPLSQGFSRQEYWNGLSFPSPGHSPNLGVESRSPCCRQVLCLLSHLLYCSARRIREDLLSALILSDPPKTFFPTIN